MSVRQGPAVGPEEKEAIREALPRGLGDESSKVSVALEREVGRRFGLVAACELFGTSCSSRSQHKRRRGPVHACNASMQRHWQLPLHAAIVRRPPAAPRCVPVQVRTAVAMAVASIAKWDCPQQWPALIPGLVQAITAKKNVNMGASMGDVSQLSSSRAAGCGLRVIGRARVRNVECGSRIVLLPRSRSSPLPFGPAPSLLPLAHVAVSDSCALPWAPPLPSHSSLRHLCPKCSAVSPSCLFFCSQRLCALPGNVRRRTGRGAGLSLSQQG